MTIAGFTLPALSAYDPPVAGEGSLDPMGLAAISDRLADRLVPGLRARMQRMRFVTATAVGALSCETLVDESAADEVSTPAICFEWVVLEAFVRRLKPNEIPSGVPGSQKARNVVNRKQRLSAPTYLKGPKVFGFNGVYKPFSVDAGIVDSSLEPGVRCAELIRAWEQENDAAGFTDDEPGSRGAALRRDIRDEVRSALRTGHVATKTGSRLFGRLAQTLHPDHAATRERRYLRSLLNKGPHEQRGELAQLLTSIEEADVELVESRVLAAIRPQCSVELGAVVDAVVAYEEFARVADAVFRTLCFVSHSQGTRPMTPVDASKHGTVVRGAKELPRLYERAIERMARIDAVGPLEQDLGELAIKRSPPELVEVVMLHHEAVQGRKPPNGKRSWFEPLRDGWVVRRPYGSPYEPEIGASFVHPIRVAALQRFLKDSAP
jgi:hypothetical protein